VKVKKGKHLVNEHLDSVPITDSELMDWLATKAAKSETERKENAQRASQLNRAVRSKVLRDTEIKACPARPTRRRQG
jgi:hypothetical protein